MSAEVAVINYGRTGERYYCRCLEHPNEMWISRPASDRATSQLEADVHNFAAHPVGEDE